MRFRDFLRVSVLLFGGAGTALAVVSVVGAARVDDNVLLGVALGWWLVAVLIGLWLGRRMEATPGIARLLAGARSTTTLPELEPGAVLFNRLWPLAVVAVAAGALGVFIPQVPAVATGYALMAALTWRRQSSAVAAIEHRDGVQFWFDRTSPFGPPRLLRLPGLRKIEPQPASERVSAADRAPARTVYSPPGRR
ncbi:MAG TPA: hypothetical protein VHG69_03500 [Thermoleophilaceae bacterium]|nr:hypothetical protein [Thermoleophilaceae bacterium]